MLPNRLQALCQHTKAVLSRLPALSVAIQHPSRSVNTKVQVFKTITQQEVDEFAKLTNDQNPIHKSVDSNSRPFVHGALINALVAGVIGTHMPGPGTIVVSQSFSFPHKCVVDKQIEISVEVIEWRKIIKVAYECRQDEKCVFTGTARLVTV